MERLSARGTGEAQARGSVSLANSGVINGPVVLTPARVPRSGYLLQVESIAADRLRSREDELAAMADFCAAAEVELPYWRWLAPAWAGKSALMAHFVLNPPPGVDVVSFFITARLAAQNDRTAFCEVVQRQLHALLGEEEPPTTVHTRDEQLRLALDRAAEVCAARGRRLVLVVDGLDEDRGVTAGPDSHSIAALLPRVPTHGLRVLVAGRPHPPVPDDVPGGHPLRDTAIDHRLTISPHALAVRAEAENDLLRLLDGGGLGRDLVGLVAAAGGGLSAADLAELAESRTRLVARELSAVSGRGFRLRVSRWELLAGLEPRPMLYLLAHEEIQKSALDLLNDAELAGYRARLHRWAERFQRAGWPTDTPEYLLSGYVRLLREQGETTRLIALATDAVRHERQWQVSGSDLEALTEIAGSFDHLLGEEDPDVAAAARLAASRDALHDRMGGIPDELIALWAGLGRLDRAVNLARAQGSPYEKARALSAVARALAAAGRLDQAVALAGEVQDDVLQSEAMRVIAGALASVSHPDQAVELARAIGDPGERVRALADITAVWAAGGGRERAAELAEETVGLARAVTGIEDRASAMAAAAGACAVAGQDELAAELVAEATQVACSALDPARRAEALAAVAEEWATALPESASDVVRQAAGAVRAVTDQADRRWAVRSVVVAAARAGLHETAMGLALGLAQQNERDRSVADTAEALAETGRLEPALETARLVEEPYLRAPALAAVARALAAAGESAQATAVAEEALGVARTIPVTVWRIDVLTAVASALAAVGLDREAVRLASEATDSAHVGGRSREQVRTLAEVATALAVAGHRDQAVEFARHAAELYRANDDVYERAGDLSAVAGALRAVGREDSASALVLEAADRARAHPHPSDRVDALGDAAEVLAAAGHTEQALELARQAAAIAREEVPRRERRSAVRSVADAFSAAGRHDEAIEVAAGFDDRPAEADTLAEVVRSLAAAGQLERAVEVADGIDDGWYHDIALAHLAGALAAEGGHDRATVLADGLEGSIREGLALPVIARALAAAGHPDRAADLARTIADADVRGGALAAVAQALGPTPSGRRLLVEALHLTRWDQLVEAVGVVTPQSLHQLADVALQQARAAVARLR